MYGLENQLGLFWAKTPKGAQKIICREQIGLVRRTVLLNTLYNQDAIGLERHG